MYLRNLNEECYCFLKGQSEPIQLLTLRNKHTLSNSSASSPGKQRKEEEVEDGKWESREGHEGVLFLFGIIFVDTHT